MGCFPRGAPRCLRQLVAFIASGSSYSSPPLSEFFHCAAHVCGLGVGIKLLKASMFFARRWLDSGGRTGGVNKKSLSLGSFLPFGSPLWSPRRPRSLLSGGLQVMVPGGGPPRTGGNATCGAGSTRWPTPSASSGSFGSGPTAAGPPKSYFGEASQKKTGHLSPD